MTEKVPNGSVPEEQFGKSENIEEKQNSESSLEEAKNSIPQEDTVSNKADELLQSAEKDKTDDLANEKPDTEKTSENDDTGNSEESVDNEKDNLTTDIEETDLSTNKRVDKNPAEAEKESDEIIPDLSETDYTKLDKEQLVSTLEGYYQKFDLELIKDHVDAIKSAFYKIHNREIEEIHKSFIDSGGSEQDFKVEESPIEINLKEILSNIRDKKSEHNKSLEAEKETNLQAKYDIIEAIKELVNSQESLHKTFHDFRNLQERWREIGPVPQKNVKDLWESYHYHVEAFYDYIKINKELRDLDFKKNLDAKMVLCEKAEELIIEPSVVEAFKKLQLLHDQWREIGPVPPEKRSELWERFKEATSKINHRHQEYFVNLKDEQKKNLQEKTALCEKAEEIAALVPENAKLWEEKSRELIELQKIWKTIGFAPKKYNTKIYERFRAACDSFFNQKRDYFAQNHEEQENNLQLKTELCIQAESLQDNTDWKKTTDDFIKLQKRWKAIGPVPIKSSDKIWKRFRAACDTFFNNKSHYFENIDSKYEENLRQKEALISEIENYKPSADVNENLDQLKEFQRKWADIGFVPIKQKNEIQEKFRETINNKFDELKLDEDKKTLLKFRSRIESITSKPNADRRISMERDKCYNKLKQLENDIVLWENNIGFFSNSKNAKSMISDVERKISSAKRKIEILQEKINIIDELE